jgi:hypothetical protein
MRLRFLPLLLCCAWLAPAHAPAQTPIEAIQSVFDEVASGLNYVGRKAGGLIPGLGVGEEPQAAYTETRPFSERLPVGPAPVISISNEFGQIRVTSWEERVVQVNAEVKVGAETADVAAEIARTIDIRITPSDNLIEIRTFLPDTRRDLGVVTMEVNYDITVPSGASLVSDNFFGDTTVRGLSGLVAVESQYGIVDLSNLGGEVKARAHGEFPLRATGLAQGGVFDLHSAHAEFSNIGGRLRVHNFRGSVRLQDLAPEVSADVVSDNGPITLLLTPEAEPDLTVNMLYGTLESDLTMTRASQGKKLTARYPSDTATQRIVLGASFGDVRIERRAAEGAQAAPADTDAKSFSSVITRSETLAAGGALRIEALPGDVRVEGVDGDAVSITATRTVWADSASKAPAMLEGLDLQVEAQPTRLLLKSVLKQDPAQLGARPPRIDIVVQCPRATPVTILAESGVTQVSHLDGAVTVEQAAGAVQTSNTAAALVLSNQKGDIQVQRALGPVQANGRYGTVLLQEVSAAITTQSFEGQTVLDNPRGVVTVRQSKGDVRILALEAIGGAFDVLVEEGTLSLVLGPNSDAGLHLLTTNGAVHTGIPLDGTLTRTTQEFRGRLKEGTHAIRLEARNGDILLD